MNIVVIGGGAAGFFGAITCAEHNADARVRLFEAGKSYLQKVRISGGGRCNVTHACFDPRELCGYYPRGNKALLGPFTQFGPAAVMEWFAGRGTPLKTESDGRVFPVSNDSQSIIDCLWDAARSAGVVLHNHHRVTGLEPGSTGWRIGFSGHPDVEADRVLVATGSSPHAWTLLSRLGLELVPPVPSLFTFTISDVRLRGLAGISVPGARVQLPQAGLEAEGPLLITHWGCSGPAILRLSAWGARALHDLGYRCEVRINWPGQTRQAVEQELASHRQASGRRQIAGHSLFDLPLRLWQHLVKAAGIPDSLRWADMSKSALAALAAEISEGRYFMTGKSTYKEEFVTAGGVALTELGFRDFQCKRFPGLYMAGEVLDIDAVTGGFNFQAAWTGGYLAGRAMASV